MALRGLPLLAPSYKGWNRSCVRTPSTASIATRPCLSSDSRYLLNVFSSVLEKPNGSNTENNGSCTPTRSFTDIDSAADDDRAVRGATKAEALDETERSGTGGGDGNDVKQVV